MALSWAGKSGYSPSYGAGPPASRQSPENTVSSSSLYTHTEPGLCPGVWMTSSVTSATSKIPPSSISISGSVPACDSRHSRRSRRCRATGDSSRSATATAAATCAACP